MSDISTLSHEYEANALFADEINSLVLLLKKHAVRPESVDFHEVQKARETLRALLEPIHAALKSELAHTTLSIENRMTIPSEVVDKLYEEFKNKLHYFIDDLQEVADKLQKDAKIDVKSTILLDMICDVTDGVASNAFRRLWRR
jgi:hypothetical protein